MSKSFKTAIALAFLSGYFLVMLSTMPPLVSSLKQTREFMDSALLTLWAPMLLKQRL